MKITHAKCLIFATVLRKVNILHLKNETRRNSKRKQWSKNWISQLSEKSETFIDIVQKNVVCNVVINEFSFTFPP